MQFFTSFISFTLSVAFNSVSLTVKWVFSFLAGAASSSAAWFHKGMKHKCVHLNVFFKFYQYFKEVDTVEGEHTFICYILNNPHLIGKPLTWAAGAAAAAMGIIPTSWMFKVFCKVTQKWQMKHNSPPAVRWQSYSQITRQTLRSSLRSDTSNKVRLAMSLTSCWILGEYCLGAPSSGGVAMASEWVAGLVFSCLRAQRAGVCRWSCCLENKEKDKPAIRTLKHQVCKSFVKYGWWRTQYYREGKTQLCREDED